MGVCLRPILDGGGRGGGLPPAGFQRLVVDDVHVCSSTSKVVVELSSEGGARAVKLMHSLYFTDDGLIAEFVPYVCSF